jgi:AcrR family transcriptional regulator
MNASASKADAGQDRFPPAPVLLGIRRRGGLARKRPTSARKRPSQARSRDTVQVILDAAAQVFEARGWAAATTNRIAERAGVSVGSVYEYFPNKDAIAVSLAERELERERDALLAVLAQADPDDLAGLLRRLVERIVDFHARSPALYRILFDEADHPPELHACVLRSEEAIAHALEAVLRRRRPAVAEPDLAAHLVVQTAESLAHRFVVRGIHDLDRARFVEEVTRLLARYVGARPV